MAKLLQGQWKRKKARPPQVALPLRPLEPLEYGPNVVEFPGRVSIECRKILERNLWIMNQG